MNRNVITIILTIVLALGASGTAGAQRKTSKKGAAKTAKTAPAQAKAAPAPAAPANTANLMDINSAPAEKLMTLPGIDIGMAKKIIEHRPYKTKNELSSKKIIPQDAYDHIANSITAVQDTTKAPPKGKKP